MKFLTLEQRQLGALIGDTVIDVPLAGQQLGQATPGSLVDLVTADAAMLEQTWQLANSARRDAVACRQWNQVTPLAPLPVPRRNIFCLGKNYLEHVREVAAKLDQDNQPPAKPIFFTKATTAVIGPGDPIPRHAAQTAKLDYEAELALIIGRGGCDIARDQAWDHVFGYTCINDVSARDLQRDHRQWFRAKSLNGFAPMGPLVVHRSVMPPAEQIRIQSWVNGEPRQDDTFDHLIFDVPEIIAVLSAGMTLRPGDIIATGTPSGVGMGFTPPRYLERGDEIVVSVSGAGELRNGVR